MKFQRFLKYFDLLVKRAVGYEKSKLKQTAAMTATKVTPSHETETTYNNGGGRGAGGQSNDSDAKNRIKITRAVFSGKLESHDALVGVCIDLDGMFLTGGKLDRQNDNICAEQ